MRYCDPWSEVPVADEWELYNLDADPTEACNLLIFNHPFPTVIDESQLPSGLGMTTEEIAAQASELRSVLAEQEAAMLSPYPSEYPTAGASVGR